MLSQGVGAGVSRCAGLRIAVLVLLLSDSCCCGERATSSLRHVLHTKLEGGGIMSKKIVLIFIAHEKRRSRINCLEVSIFPKILIKMRRDLDRFKITMAGKSKTSLMLLVSVKNMVIRSRPQPQPPVGGSPYSRAVQKFSSIICASSSPRALSPACCSNRSR
jgi:hypothetical protein